MHSERTGKAKKKFLKFPLAHTRAHIHIHTHVHAYICMHTQRARVDRNEIKNHFIGNIYECLNLTHICAYVSLLRDILKKTVTI